MPLIPFPLPPLTSDAGHLVAIHPLIEPPSDTNAQLKSSDSASSIKLLAVNHLAQLLIVELDSGEVHVLLDLDIPVFDSAMPIQLVLSPEGDYVAVSNRYGRYAAVYSLTSPAEILRLDRGDYHEDKSMFPLAFALCEGRLLLVHATAWNRLDMTEIPTGRDLTRRPLEAASKGETSQAAESIPDLDYFHGKLLVSPDGAWLADTGWVWAPVGLIRTYSLPQWLTNPWEAENGSSVHYFFQTEDWDLPFAWLDHDRLAVWGQVDVELLDEEDWADIGYKPAIAVFDARTGQLTQVIRSVPAYTLASRLTNPPASFPYPLAELAVSGDRVFMWGNDVPLQVWRFSTNTLEEILQETAHYPAVYHQQAGVFIELTREGNCSAFQYVGLSHSSCG